MCYVPCKQSPSRRAASHNGLPTRACFVPRVSWNPDLHASMALLRVTALAFLLFVSALIAACGDSDAQRPLALGDTGRGRELIQRYGCIACHTVAGLPSYGANVGPPLVNMAERGYLAGVLPNTPEHMVRWLRDPPAVDPRTAMPNLGLSDSEAADIAAYLYASH
jgi:cytochrome c